MIGLVIMRFHGAADRHLLADLLWEEQSSSAARANLRNLLSWLKGWQERNGVLLVEYDRSRVFRSERCLAADLDRLMAARPASDDDSLAAVCSVWSGELLEGIGDGFGSDLAAWVAGQRWELRERLLGLTLAAASQAGPHLEPVVRRIAGQAPLDERAQRALLVHLARHRTTAVVAAEYRSIAERLKAETGSGPERETRLLASSLGVETLPAQPEDEQPAPVAVRPKRGLPRILILPPMDDDPDAALTKIAAGLVDDVTFSLCRMRTMAVIAPHTARIISREGRNAPVALDVDYVLFTRLLPGAAADERRFGFSLARTANEEILLGDYLRFRTADLPARHADLARVVAAHVASGVERTERQSFRSTGTPSAYLHFLMGQDRMRSLDLPDIRAARKSFREALELAPRFSPAMSMIARTLSIEWLLRNGADDELLAASQAMAQRAVEADPLDPGGYRELGNAALYRQDLEAMLSHHAEARDRAPHHADVLLDNADALVHASRYKEARPIIQLAMSLNPLPPDDYPWVASTIEFFERNFDGALNYALSMKNPEPLGRFIAASAFQLGDREKARHWRDRMMERHPDFRVAQWGAIVPIHDPADRAFAIDVMRDAGFP